MGILDVELVSVDGFIGEMALGWIYCPHFDQIPLADSHGIQAQIINAGAYGLFGMSKMVAFV